MKSRLQKKDDSLQVQQVKKEEKTTKTYRAGKMALCAIVLLAALFAVIAWKGSAEDAKKKVIAATEVEKSGDTGSEKTLTLKKKCSLHLGEITSLVPDGEKFLSGKSGKSKVVTVSKTGTVHALQQGKAKVTIRTRVKKEKKIIKRIYTVTVWKSGMVYPVFSMMKGEHLDLQFSLKGTKAKWSSSNSSVAKVSKAGKVTARKKGHATLTGVTSKGKKYQCKLTVTRKIKSVIYLTFDDGPSRYSTPKILNILKKNHVKATFFELKPAQKDFDLTKRVIDEGHTLALHGYQHKYDTVYRSQKAYRDNLDKLRNLFYHKYGVWCTISRFPGGSSNTVSRYNPGIMTKLTKKVHDWGYHYFDWNVDSNDAGGARSAAETFANFKKELCKGRANVVLMHDFANNDKTINALDRMIKYGKKNGYTFLPITASTGEIHHGVNN